MQDFSAGRDALALYIQANAQKDLASQQAYNVGNNISRIGDRLSALGNVLDEKKDRQLANKRYDEALQLQREVNNSNSALRAQQTKGLENQNNLDSLFFNALIKSKEAQEKEAKEQELNPFK